MRGKEVGDCTKIDVRHHGVQWLYPLMSERRRGADGVPSVHSWVVRVGEVEGARHRLEANGVVVHV
jgi:hypothetical protein